VTVYKHICSYRRPLTNRKLLVGTHRNLIKQPSIFLYAIHSQQPRKGNKKLVYIPPFSDSPLILTHFNIPNKNLLLRKRKDVENGK
jgi:hypothetical protein